MSTATQSALRISPSLSALFARDLSRKNIVIVGCPASGKTTLAKELAKRTGQKVFHTDDYMQHGYKQSLYVLIADLMEQGRAVIVEGVQGYRLLRKGVETQSIYPDIVIELKVSPEQVERVYRTERVWDKRRSVDKVLKNLEAFNKMHETILADYMAMKNPHPPEWIVIENKF